MGSFTLYSSTFYDNIVSTLSCVYHELSWGQFCREAFVADKLVGWLASVGWRLLEVDLPDSMCGNATSNNVTGRTHHRSRITVSRINCGT